jgi:predicted RNA-binding Zn ribbon-like protein
MKASHGQTGGTGPSDGAPFLPLIGGALCLELCNTISRRYTDAPVEHLPDYPALLRWAEHAGALDASAAAQLKHLAARRPGDGVQVLARARHLRTALHGAILRAVEHGAPDPTAVASIDEHVRHAFAARRLVASTTGTEWQWADDGNPLMRPLWPVALSAAALLSSPGLARVRECAGRADGCGWLFLDTGRGRGRRWCSMDLCGNRSKVRRHYQRAQQR